MLLKIFYGVWCDVKQNKEKTHTQNPPESTKKEPPLPSANHPNPPRNPPQVTPQPTASQTPHQNQPKTHSATHRNPLHKTKNQTPNQPNLINFNPPATIKPITGKTITQNRQQSNPWQIW
jgi:hypothetical protein